MTLTEVQLVALRMIEDAVIQAHDEGVPLCEVIAEVSTVYLTDPTNQDKKGTDNA